MININKQFEKFYIEQKTGTVHKTIFSCKEMTKFPIIDRVWKKDNHVYTYQVFSCGESICTIKNADRQIWRKIQRDFREGKIRL